jgi:SAM-dependent methyltransferase
MLAQAQEIDALKHRYERRAACGGANRYSPLDPYVMLSEQERDRAIARLLHSIRMADRVAKLSLLEIGCGNGGNLQRFLQLGFSAERVVGNELLPERLQTAGKVLPTEVRLLPGDATNLDIAENSYDVVLLFTVLSSILDDAFQERIAAKAWSLVRPGGGVLCYDFVYNNPANRDVRGVPIRRMRELFPHAAPKFQRLTLAPPLGRAVARWWTGGYTLLNRLPLLRSHVLAWLPKQESRPAA